MGVETARREAVVGAVCRIFCQPAVRRRNLGLLRDPHGLQLRAAAHVDKLRSQMNLRCGRRKHLLRGSVLLCREHDLGVFALCRVRRRREQCKTRRDQQRVAQRCRMSLHVLPPVMVARPPVPRTPAFDWQGAAERDDPHAADVARLAVPPPPISRLRRRRLEQKAPDGDEAEPP